MYNFEGATMLKKLYKIFFNLKTLKFIYVYKRYLVTPVV